MIGAAVLATGLLLVLAGLVAARIPGGAFARPGIARFVLSPIDPATWYANGAILVGLFVGVAGGGLIVTLLSTGLTTLVGGVGVVFIALAIEGSRLLARVERRRVFAGERPRPIAHAYRPLRGRILDILRAEFADESRWRDVLYAAINIPLSVVGFLVVAAAWLVALTLLTLPAWYDVVAGRRLPGIPASFPNLDATSLVVLSIAGLLLLPVAASLSKLVVALHRGVVMNLLCTSEARELRRQVETLRESRSAVIDVEASELGRIERDLHDGAQQRLVMLSIDLGLASERIDTDPAAARQLVLEGQEQARQALAEIRDLVRGIAPAILTDRGLVAALGSIAGRNAVPTRLSSDLPADLRLPPAIERAAYFVVAEALANVAKHSRASRCEIRCRRDGARLVVEVWDDGAGGAAVGPGGGLAGLQSRVSGVDGTFTVESPAGGPTLVRAELPVSDWATEAPQEPR